jgi:hypothetical protein
MTVKWMKSQRIFKKLGWSMILKRTWINTKKTQRAELNKDVNAGNERRIQ